MVEKYTPEPNTADETAESSPPEKPGYDECCGSSCPNCVWDVYYEELGKWRESQGLPGYGNSLTENE